MSNMKTISHIGMTRMVTQSSGRRKNNELLDILSMPGCIEVLKKIEKQNNGINKEDTICKNDIQTSTELRNKTASTLSSLKHVSNNRKKNDFLSYLADKKVVEKTDVGNDDDDKAYLPSSLGRALIVQTRTFEFLHKYKDYLSDHRFGDVPPFLLMQIGRLLKCEFVHGLPLNFVKWKQMMHDADEYVYCIFTHPPILLADWIIPKLPNLNTRLLFGRNSVVKECNDFVNKLELTKHGSASSYDGVIEKKMSDMVLLNVIITEKQACLMFPWKNNDDVKNTTDIHASFVSSDPEFHGWCLDFFRYKWNNENAQNFSRFKF